MQKQYNKLQSFDENFFQPNFFVENFQRQQTRVCKQNKRTTQADAQMSGARSQRGSEQQACGRDKQATSRQKAAPNSLRSRAAQAKVRTRKKGASEELRIGRLSVVDERTISHRTHSTIADYGPQPTSQVDKPLDAAKTTKRVDSAGSTGARKKKQNFFTRRNRFTAVNQQDCLRTKTAIKV